LISDSNSNRADIDIDVNRLNDYFISKSSRTKEIDFDIPQTENVPEFSFSTVAETDVKEAILSVKSNAAGVDELPLSFIKILLPTILPVFTHIFNHIFTCSIFPDRWKTSIVLPIPKIGKPVGFSDFRPTVAPKSIRTNTF
jgi:hypothetical protein